MIEGVGAVSAGANYGMLRGATSAPAADAKRTVTDRWIPGGDQDREGYSGEIGIKSQHTPAEEQQIEDLKKRDREVRHHEQTHAAILGSYAVGAPSYTYQVGPDGKAYAVGGSVTVDMGGTGSDAADAAKSLKIRSAAGAVGDMSAADMLVSMQA